MELTNELKILRTWHERRQGELKKLKTDIKEIEHKIQKGNQKTIRLERALEIVKRVGLKTQKQLEYHLAEQVNLAMDAVFDDPYQLKVNFHEKRGKTEVELLFTRGDMEFPPIGSSGGGVIDVASLALRIAYWAMRQDQKSRPVLILDEPFSQLKGIDANSRALEIIKEISEQLNLQIISVSDERISRSDIIEKATRVFQVSKNSGISIANLL